MTQALITIDPELFALFHQRGMSARANFESSILGRCAAWDFGTGWQTSFAINLAIKFTAVLDVFRQPSANATFVSAAAANKGVDLAFWEEA
jgi:hypothetical protein